MWPNGWSLYEGLGRGSSYGLQKLQKNFSVKICRRWKNGDDFPTKNPHFRPKISFIMGFLRGSGYEGLGQGPSYGLQKFAKKNLGLNFVVGGKYDFQQKSLLGPKLTLLWVFFLKIALKPSDFQTFRLSSPKIS